MSIGAALRGCRTRPGNDDAAEARYKNGCENGRERGEYGSQASESGDQASERGHPCAASGSGTARRQDNRAVTAHHESLALGRYGRTVKRPRGPRHALVA